MSAQPWLSHNLEFTALILILELRDVNTRRSLKNTPISNADNISHRLGSGVQPSPSLLGKFNTNSYSRIIDNPIPRSFQGISIHYSTPTSILVELFVAHSAGFGYGHPHVQYRMFTSGSYQVAIG